MQLECPWYVTADATRDYLRIAGFLDDDGGPAWGRAEQELFALIAAAHVVDGVIGPTQLYRTGRVQIGWRITRLEFIVATDPRPEGKKPQLLRVREKGIGRKEGAGARARRDARRAQLRPEQK